MMIPKFSKNWIVLDIETTGFYADDSLLVAIGIKDRENEKILFVRKPSEEKNVLLEFIENIKQKRIETIIGYNIINFDLPYLRAKLFLHSLNFKILDSLLKIDLFEYVKNNFRLKNKSLREIGKKVFKIDNSESLNIPNYYLNFLENKEEKFIIEHLKDDLNITFLLAKKLEIID